MESINLIVVQQNYKAERAKIRESYKTMRAKAFLEYQEKLKELKTLEIEDIFILNSEEQREIEALNRDMSETQDNTGTEDDTPF